MNGSRVLRTAALGVAAMLGVAASAAPMTAATALALSASAQVAQDSDVLRRHVATLAADELEGRFTGSEGARRAADYIAAELARLGAVPLPGQDDYRQPFEFTAGVSDAGTKLEVLAEAPGSAAEPRGAERSGATFAGGDVQALSFSDSGAVEGAVVFAGYGLTVPDSQGYPYDSYFGLDVEDKIVVVLRYVPEGVEADTRAILGRYSGLRYKAMRARELGAKALLVVTGPRSPNGGELVPMSFDTAISGSGIVAASISGAVGEALFERLPERTLEATQAELDTGNPHVAGFEVPGLRLRLEARVERQQHLGANVVGWLPPGVGTSPAAAANDEPAGQGSDPPGSLGTATMRSATMREAAATKPYIVLGAHYDHLGRGGSGNSLARRDEAGDVHNGADDNASGVAAVLAVAEILKDMPRRRGIVLAFWSGEELGLLGSSAFVRQPPVPVEHIAAYLNFDMVGRAEGNRLVLQAVGSSGAWPRLIEQANVPVGFDILVQEDPYLPTDSSAFNLAGVPNLSFFTGSHEDYHRPSDDAERINYEDLGRVARLGALIARRLAELEEPPAFVAVERSSENLADRDSVRAFTGTIPDYATEVEGLLLGGVIEGGPAEEAGLRGGDVIVEFAGQAITNIYDYTYALDAVKIGEPVQVVYLRDGERHETTLVPRARR